MVRRGLDHLNLQCRRALSWYKRPEVQLCRYWTPCCIYLIINSYCCPYCILWNSQWLKGTVIIFSLFLGRRRRGGRGGTAHIQCILLIGIIVSFSCAHVCNTIISGLCSCTALEDAVSTTVEAMLFVEEIMTNSWSVWFDDKTANLLWMLRLVCFVSYHHLYLCHAYCPAFYLLPTHIGETK